MDKTTTSTSPHPHTPTHKLLALPPRVLVAVLVVAYVGLGVTYALVTPCFESPDEWSHLSLVHYWAMHRALPPRILSPRRSIGPDVTWYLEYHDPPLYYAPPLYHSLAALLTSWANMNDLPYLLVPSPSWAAGWAPQPDGDPWNKNLFVHRAEETLAQSGTVQAASLLRVVSLGLGVVTILCTYALAHLLWPDRPVLALGAATFVAFNPQFVALSVGVTNDNLLNALFSLSLVVALRFMCNGASWSRWAMLGGLVGLGLLTKQSGLLLLPLGLLAMVWQRGSASPPVGGTEGGASLLRRKVLVDGGAFLAAALGVGGWWYVRNTILYDDPLGLEPHFASQAPLTRFGLNEAAATMRSYWAAFGWAPILVEPPVYAVVGLITLAGLAGIVMAIRPGGSVWRAPTTTRRGLALLAIALVLNVVAYGRWAIATGVLSGRLLFPTLSAAGVLTAWGLYQWRRWRAARWGLGVVVGLAFLFTALVPWRYLYPAYASPHLPDGMPDTAQPVDSTFQGGVRLAGYEAVAEDLEPGDKIRLTLYWHALTPPKRRYRVWVQLAPHDPTCKVAECDVWLGGTLYPSEMWQADDAVRQVYRLAVPDWAPAPGLYWIRVGLVDDTETRVALADNSGDMAVLGPWRMRAVFPPPPPTCTTDFSLGTAIRLLGYDLEQREAEETTPTVCGRLHLALYWLAERVPETDYTVYVHLMGEEDRLLGQHDGPPRDGAYPTSWWLPGEIVVDRHTIRLDEPIAGPAWLRVGMYDPATLVRLPAYDGTGQRLPDDTIPLVGTIGSGDE